MNMIHGLLTRALRNNSITLRSASPTYGEYNSAADIDKKFVFIALATAHAKLVLAHPGGPYNKIPKQTNILA